MDVAALCGPLSEQVSAPPRAPEPCPSRCPRPPRPRPLSEQVSAPRDLKP